MRKLLLLVVLTSASVAGCTSKAWYEGFQQQQRAACGRYPQQYEVQRCLDKLNNLSYEQYKAQTDGVKANQPTP